METITLLLAVLFSLTVSTSNPELPQGNNATTTSTQTITNPTCEENCQLPPKPDDDEDDD